jgi:hypothetical protein
MNKRNVPWLVLLMIIVFLSVIGIIYYSRLRFATEPIINKTQVTPFPTNLGEKGTLIISGYVVSGGDTTPEGLLDAPRKLVYAIKEDDGSLVSLTYTAYPPSPFGDKEREKIRLTFHGGTIRIGDYLKASGTYDGKSNILTVAEEGDYIETYSGKP